MINKKVSAIVVAGVLVVGAAFSVYAATHCRPGNNSSGIGMEMNREGSDSDTGMNRGSRGSGGSDQNRPPAPPKDSNSMNRMPGGPGGMNGQGKNRPERDDQSQDGSNGNRPDFSQGKPGAENPMDIEIKEKIDSIEDSDTKEKLTSLYEAFKSAMDSERELLDSESADSDDLEKAKSAAKEAMDALITAFKDAGLEMSRPEPPADKENRKSSAEI